MWCIYWDIFGIICLLFGLCTLLFISYVTQFYVISPWMPFNTFWGAFHSTTFLAIVSVVIWCYFKATTTDPGSVQKNTATVDDIWAPASDPERHLKPKRRFCEKCQCIKPPRAHHCSTCKRCINKMDHHCPWINNCVGSNNMKHFLQFIVWTFIGCTYAATLSIYRGVMCYKNPYICQPFPPTSGLLMYAGSTILALFFAIFVAAMASDQYEGLVTDTTGIESMNNWIEDDRSLSEGLLDACGESFRLSWILPFSMSKSSPSFYEYSPDHDPDAYDPRDPRMIKHFRRLEQYLKNNNKYPAPPLPGEKAVSETASTSSTLRKRNVNSPSLSSDDGLEQDPSFGKGMVRSHSSMTVG